MTQESRTQENRTQGPRTPTPASGELTAAELACVAGGTDGAPGGPTEGTSRSRM